jgi:hypothetical protein
MDKLLVACLCAAWCGTCRDYRATFDAVAGGMGARARWIDIEDEADALGSLDVDDFPTVLIARGGKPLFFGPITPQPATLERLLRAAGDASLPAPPASAELMQLLARLAETA